MFKNSLLTRANISSYYIALLFSVLFFQQDWFKDILNTMRSYLLMIFQSLNRGASFSEWTSYSILLLVCFLVVFLMRSIVVKPANLFLDDETARDNFESLPFFILIFGAFLFYVNVYVGDIMPRDIPPVFRSVLGSGPDAGFASNLWNTLPIVMFVFVNSHRRKANAEKASSAAEKH